MTKLNHDQFQKAQAFLNTKARPLDLALFCFRFQNGPAETVINEIARFQNSDGGLGNSLEPDFRLVDSSPMATAVGLHFLSAVQASPAHPVIQRIMKYLRQSLDTNQLAWTPVPPAIDNVPRAPWWAYESWFSSSQNVATWANPAAEIIGFLHEFPSGAFDSDLVQRLTEKALANFDSLPVKAEMHAFLSYLHFARRVPQTLALRMVPRLKEMARDLVGKTDADWMAYGLRPYWAIACVDSPLLPEFSELLTANLDWEITQQQDDGSWAPFWSWGQHEDEWQSARREWQGHLTVKLLSVLSEFHRIEV